MPAADTTYVIGVIREREKGFLQADEYTRLTQAAAVNEAIRVLSDTPYGKWLGAGGDLAEALAALSNHLVEVHDWLGDAVLDKRIWRYTSARYDALNMARALTAYVANVELPADLSPLGSIAPDVIQSTVWHNLNWENLPVIWRKLVQEVRENRVGFTALKIAQRCAQIESSWRKNLAVTPLLKEIDRLIKEREEAEIARRPFGSEDNASEFEQVWDEKMLLLLKKYRLEPVGYDAIVAYWYGKELEVKQLRLLLAAKASQLSEKKMAELRRSEYRSL